MKSFECDLSLRGLLFCLDYLYRALLNCKHLKWMNKYACTKKKKIVASLSFCPTVVALSHNPLLPLLLPAVCDLI